MKAHGNERQSSKELVPPISSKNPNKALASSTISSNWVHPAIVFQKEHHIRPNRNPSTYLALQLKTAGLNDIHQLLWLAGLPTPARPLHKQKLLGRSIALTEDPDEHLVWFEAQMFLKPLPDFLLDYQFWMNNICLDQELHESACGFLLSYSWLICYESDLSIAKETGLISKSVEWKDWVKFLDVFLDNIDLDGLSDINKRYRYGELRLSRLNSIYRLAPPVYTLRGLIRGYRSGSTWHKAFFESNFKWMLAVFATLSVVLNALQVGLTTNVLQANAPFQKISYGFVVTSLVTVVTGMILILVVWLSLFVYHLASSWRTGKAVISRRSSSLSP